MARESADRTESVRPASVVDAVYERIYQRLMTLKIPPGARIPIDVIARELDTSQTPVREALGRLEQQGLVQKAHLIGYSAAPQLSKRQFDDLFAFRLLLEPAAARIAAENAAPDLLARIESAAANMDDGGVPLDRNSRYSLFARADAEFHDAILRMAGNEVMRIALSSQHIHLHLFRLMFHVRVTQEALEEHQKLMSALRKGNGDKAEKAMRTHIERSYRRLLPAFEA